MPRSIRSLNLPYCPSRDPVELLRIGLRGDDINGSDRAVAPKQGPLRSSKDLDSFHVVEEGDRRLRPRNVDFIYMEADVGVCDLCEVGVADPPHSELNGPHAERSLVLNP